MTQQVTLELPEDTLRRYQLGATAARKRLEEFLAERLTGRRFPRWRMISPRHGKKP